MTNPVYALILFFAGSVSLAIAGFAWRRRPAAGADALAATLLTMALWAWAYGCVWLAPSNAARLFWLNLAVLGTVTSSPAFLVMSAKFMGNSYLLTRKFYMVISFIPISILLLLWSDQAFGLFWGGVDVFHPDNFKDAGLGYMLMVVNGFLDASAAIYLLFRSYRSLTRTRREQVNIISIGLSIPLVTILIRMLGLSPFPMLDLTPVTFALSAILFAYGMLSYQMLDLAPMGRTMVMEKMDDGIVVLDHFDRVVDINRKALIYLLADFHSPVGRSLKDGYPEWEAQIHGYTVSETFTIRVELERIPGRALDMTITPLLDEGAELIGRLVVWHDVTNQREAEDKLRTFFMAVAQSPSAIMITSADEKIEYVNEQFEVLTGYSRDEVVGLSPGFLNSGKMPPTFYERMLQTLREGKPWQGELINQKKNGDLYWEDQYIAPVFNDFGVLSQFVAIKQDASERKQSEGRLWLANENLKVQLAEIERLHSQLREESIRDSLTRLFNRRYMEQTLERELARASREGIQIGVIMMDIDNFKSINDNHGHFAGDAVLQALGDLLLQSIRSTDLACRYGGDEIVVILVHASLEAAYVRAEEWRSAFSLVEFDFEGRLVKTSLSLGVSSFPIHAKTPIELLTAADKALYWAKTRKNSVAKYSAPEMSSGNYTSTDIR